MRTENLIADLARRASPVRPLLSPGTRTVGWLGVAIVFAAAGVAVFGLRPGLDSLLAQPGFLWTTALTLATCVLAARAALVLAIPGAERSVVLRIAAVIVIGLWALTLVTAIVRAGYGFAGVSHWYICFVRIVAIGLVPAVAVVAMLRRAAPLRPAWTGALALASATAVGALAIQLSCPLNDAAHALIGHFGAVVSVAALGALSAGPLLNTRRFRRSLP